MQITSVPTEEPTTENNMIPKLDIVGHTYLNPTKLIEHDDNMLLTNYETRKPIVVPRIVSAENNNAKFSLAQKMSNSNVVIFGLSSLVLLLRNFKFLLLFPV